MELYITHNEDAAYDVAAILAISRIRCRVEPRRHVGGDDGKPLYFVMVDDTTQAQHRAIKLRDAWRDDMDIDLTCSKCGWQFTVHTNAPTMESEAYGALTEWYCPHCGQGVKA